MRNQFSVPQELLESEKRALAPACFPRSLLRACPLAVASSLFTHAAIKAEFKVEVYEQLVMFDGKPLDPWTYLWVRACRPSAFRPQLSSFRLLAV